MLIKRASSERPGTMQPGASTTCTSERAPPRQLQPSKGLWKVMMPPSMLMQPHDSAADVNINANGEHAIEQQLRTGSTQ